MRTLVLLGGLAALCLLGWHGIYLGGADRIQADVLERSGVALAATGVPGLRLDVDGRTVSVAGRVASEEQRTEVLAALAAVSGARQPIRSRLSLTERSEPGREATPSAESRNGETDPSGATQAAPDAANSGSPAATVLAARSCQERFDAELAGATVEFETGSAIVSRSSYGLLDRIAQAAQGCPEARLEVAGHTDAAGAEDLNQVVSEARAQAVADYLMGAGVSLTRLVVVGYGETRPVASNATAEGRAANRRIEIRVAGMPPGA